MNSLHVSVNSSDVNGLTDDVSDEWEWWGGNTFGVSGGSDDDRLIPVWWHFPTITIALLISFIFCT